MQLLRGLEVLLPSPRVGTHVVRQQRVRARVAPVLGKVGHHARVVQVLGGSRAFLQIRGPALSQCVVDPPQQQAVEGETG